MIRAGDEVYFYYNANGLIVEHVGHVYCVIPAGVSINRSWFGDIVSSSTAVRSIDTYVINVQGVLFLSGRVERVPESKKFLRFEDRPFKKHSFYDIRDRMILETLAHSQGVSYRMLGTSLYVPVWKKRFIFAKKDGREYITRIEKVESDTNGVLVVKN